METLASFVDGELGDSFFVFLGTVLLGFWFGID